METVEFSSLFVFIRNGMNIKQDKSGDGIPITRIETIADSTVDSSRVGFAGLTEENCRDWLMKPGDILFSHINSVEHIGKCAIYRGNPDKLVHGMNLLCLRCDETKLLPEFAKYLIRCNSFRSRLSNYINKAVNQASVSIGNLKSIPVTVPNITEQRCIAAILDQADALRAKRREALAQLDSLTQSIFVGMFGDALRSEKRIELSKLTDEFRYGTSNKSSSSGFPALRIPNVASGSLDLTEIKTVEVDDAEFQRLKLIDGDLLFVRTNGNPDYVGRCVAFDSSKIFTKEFEPSKFIYASYLIRARLKDDLILPIVLQEYFSTDEGRRALRSRCKTSAGQYNINTEGLGALPVPIFPKPQQHAFIRSKHAIEKQQLSHRLSLNEFDNLFASLQHRAFRGEL